MPSRSALADLLRGREREAAAKTESRAKSSWTARIEQVVAPLDRRAQRALALGRVARAARQERESRVEALEEPLGSEELRPRGRELDREREAVEAAADRLDRGVGCELAPDGTRPLDEERRRLARRERLEPILPLARHVQRRPARDEHAQPARGREDRADRRRRVEQVLEVVEEEQELPPAEEPGEVVGRSDRLRDLGGRGARGRRGRRAAPRRRRRAACRRARPRPGARGGSSRCRPGPVRVRRRVPFESSATSSSSSCSRPTSGLAATGRFVASSVRSGGKSPSPSWYRRSAPIRSFRRCSPRSRTARVAVERAGGSSRRGRSARRGPPRRSAPRGGRRSRRSPRP